MINNLRWNDELLTRLELNRRVRRLRSGRLDLTTVEVRRGESHTTHVENDKATACFLDRKVYIGPLT